jgi:glycosyltransferase involved in cell wall biosynthesis
MLGGPVKRLLMIVDWPRLHNGGVSRVVIETCRRLRSRGYEIGVAYHMDCALADVEIEGPAWRLPDTVKYPDTTGAAMVEGITRVLDEFRPDMVHAHTRRASRVLDLILARAPMCQFLHDQSYFCGGGHRMTRGNVPCHRPHGPVCLLNNYLLGCGGKDPRNNWEWWKGTEFFTPVKQRPSIRLQVASRLMKEGLLENGYPGERIDLIPLFSEPATVPDRTEPGRILVPGRLVREKGVYLLMETMALLRDIPWRLCMPGQGPADQDLLRLAGRHGFLDRFELPGEVGAAQMETEYARADFVVFPVLRYEPFGLIGTESMAHGKPVVAFGGGGVEEWLTPGETGIRVGERTPAALAQGIRTLLTDRPLRSRLAAGALRHYPPFHPETYVDRLEESFTKTAAGWRASRTP